MGHAIAGARVTIRREQLAFDLFVIASAVISALQRPYRQTAEVVRRLQQDGIATFAVSRLSLVPTG